MTINNCLSCKYFQCELTQLAHLRLNKKITIKASCNSKSKFDLEDPEAWDDDGRVNQHDYIVSRCTSWEEQNENN